MILGIHHVQITIPKGEEKQARAFYCSLLGLSEVAKPDSLKGRGGFWVNVGAQDVHIGTEEGFDRLTTKAHIAYLVEDLTYWRNRLTENSIKIIGAVAIPHYDRFEFRDPFGNRVEMIQALTD